MNKDTQIPPPETEQQRIKADIEANVNKAEKAHEHDYQMAVEDQIKQEGVNDV